MKDNAFVKVLGISSFRNLWLSQLISQVFLNLLFFSLMIRVYELTRNNSAVSLMVLMVTLPNILLGAVAGVLVDRGDRKIVMFLAHFLRIFAVLGFLISPETLGWLYFLAFIISIITQFFFPAEAATIPELISDKKLLLTANSLFTVTFFATVVLGNVLAGPFLVLLGTRTTFVLVALAFLIASIFTASLPGQRVVRLRHDLFGEFLTGLDYIYRTPIIIKAILVLGVSQATIGALGAIAPGFADRILKVAVADVSLLVMAPAAAGMILGAAVLGQYLRGVEKNNLIRTGLVFVAVGLLGFSMVDIMGGLIGVTPTILALPFLLALGVSNAMVDVSANTLIQENTPEEIRSRIYGVLGTFVGIGAIIPIVLSGVMADVFGVRAVILVISLFVAFFALRNLYTKT